MTKLSIIIPVYNEEPFLSRCLYSLTIPYEHIHDVEIILIDDASTDKSGEILDAEVDRVGFTVVHHTTNWGVSMTRNHGISIAKGDYITFLDADDAMSPDGIENILKVIDNNEANVIQFNHYRQQDGQGCRVDARYYCAAKEYRLPELPPKWAPVWNKIYKKAFIDEHRIRFPMGQQFDEDRQFNLQCLHYEKKITAVSAPGIMKYFDNEGSICHTMTREKLTTAFCALVNRLETFEDDPQVCEVIKRSIIQHLESKNFKQLFGGES